MGHLRTVIVFCLILIGCSEQQTILIDGSVQSKKQLEMLDSSEIFSYSKWLPGKAPPNFRKWNKKTLIVVKTKRAERKLQKERYQLLNLVLDSVDKGVEILIVKDGMFVLPGFQKNLRQLSQGQLSHAYIMDWEEAKKLYGSYAKPMTLIINLYNANY